MKKLLIICGLLFSVITFAQAQDGQGQRQGGRGMGTPEERAKRQVDNLTEKLKLTEDQKTKVTAIYAEQGASMKKLREEANGDRDAMMASMTKLNDATDAKINALLTDDQKKAFTTLKEERKEQQKKRMEGRGQGGQGQAKQ
ncbi:Spy/CpxP family protein refolding chaperone [Pedobacter frigoris]|uniref:Spy/CpxP family protein refolding chaperone n=1 Tax=Pedobacter frigoris TaxID=2571272 RepID=UPI002930D5F5|nr:Spy/CpxP family protein refolding chaperone [Pedobacter frigoris]